VYYVCMCATMLKNAVLLLSGNYLRLALYYIQRASPVAQFLKALLHSLSS